MPPIARSGRLIKTHDGFQLFCTMGNAFILLNGTSPMDRRQGFEPSVRKIPGGGNDNPLRYSCLKNPMDRVAWWTTV